MYSKPTIWAEVDQAGRLIVPSEVASGYGLIPGARLRLDQGENDIRLHRPVTHLAKIYLEPTNQCNLTCRTCFRNDWQVNLGQMSSKTFDQLIRGLRTIKSPPTVFFGGIGEPLFHPATVDMIAETKRCGARVEMITNGTLLNKERSRDLIEAGLDLLWVSIDGARAESYADVRLGAALPEVLENILRFRTMRPGGHKPYPEIGISFVAMRRNISDLPAVLAIGKRLRASRFLVTNLLPTTEDLIAETLYEHTLTDVTYLPSPWLRKLSIPKMDINDLTSSAFLSALQSNYNVTFSGFNLGGRNDVCTFIEGGSMTVGWNGNVSPCSPLLYTHKAYLHGKPRISYQHIVGNLVEQDLLSIWNDPDYQEYRDKVQRFAFAPCTFCGGCDLSVENQTDCFENPAPVCGGCLWAQGVIQCP